MQFEKCGWYSDCPFKTPLTFDIAFQDSIQPVLKGARIVAPLIINDNIAKKPKKTLSKPKRPILLLRDSDDNVQIQSNLNNIVVIGPSFSNQKAMYHASKRQSWCVGILWSQLQYRVYPF